MEHRIAGMAPRIDTRTRILVLGSMPGERSLRQGEYYAHARNRFWPIMEAVLGVPAGAPYGERIRLLNDAGVGLWDVISSCERRGSLDTGIVVPTEIYNDFESLFRSYENLSIICCNGGKAYKTFLRCILPNLDMRIATRLKIAGFPSTSPANATYSFEDIVMAWSMVLLDGSHQ